MTIPTYMRIKQSNNSDFEREEKSLQNHEYIHSIERNEDSFNRDKNKYEKPLILDFNSSN